MEITFFVLYDYFLPAYKAGGPIQSIFNLVNQLKAGIQLKVISGDKDVDGTVLDIPKNEWVDFKGIPVFYSSRGFKAFSKLHKQNSGYFINGIYSFQFNLLPILRLQGRKIISVRGMLHPQALQQKKWKKKVYLSVWKLFKLHRHCEFHVTSKIEKQYVQEIFGTVTKIWVIPNLPHILDYYELPPKSSDCLVLCSVALVSPMKNLLPVLHALKNLQVRVTYHIYGAIKDKQYWSACLKVIESMPEHISIRYHGGVFPQHVPKAIASAHVYIQPSESENFGHSLYEALTAGRPIITSYNTPWNNLKEGNAGMNVRPDPVKIGRAINFFAAMNMEELSKWSIAARNYALKEIDVERIKMQYIKMFKDEEYDIDN